METFLGLPRKLGQASVAKDGGYYGLQSDLAVGILDAIDGYDEWKLLDGNSRGKLVINLSVGWEPMCNGGGDSVRDAIEQAHERGALVLVAAGNRRPGTCVEGPTAPGSWGATASKTHQGPLVHAITPVDEGLADLVTFRPSSNTRVATRAFMIVTTDESVEPSRTLGPYSGSSVATAVTSGIAALAWSHAPGLTANALMDALWASGQPRSNVAADSYFATGGHGAPAQHVISACRALDHVRCPQGGCVPSGCVGPSGDAVQEAELACADAHQVPVIITEPAATATFDCPTCYGPVTTVAYDAQWSPDPPLLWVVPQPDDPPCPICPLSLVPNGTAYVTLLRNTVYDSYQLLSTTITVTNSGGSEYHTYGWSQLPIEPNKSYQVENEGFELVNGNPPTGASVSMTFQDGGSSFTVSNTITVN